jgi:hypothetical protein
MMVHGDAREGEWRGNWRMEWVDSTLHTASEHGVSKITTITTADAQTSAASSRLNWRPRRFKWTRPFRRKTKSDFRACAVTFQTQSTRNTIRFCKILYEAGGTKFLAVIRNVRAVKVTKSSVMVLVFKQGTMKTLKVKAKQSRYRPWMAQTVPGR